MSDKTTIQEQQWEITKGHLRATAVICSWEPRSRETHEDYKRLHDYVEEFIQNIEDWRGHVGGLSADADFLKK